MSAFYFDSSGLVKRYSVERGTKFVIDLMRPSAKNRFYSAKITEVEVCATVSRKRKGLIFSSTKATKTITRFRRNFLANFVRADLTDAIINEAIRLTDMYALRGYDAVQLATALAANRKRLSDGLSAIIFVCADSELNTAAQAEGLIVENPNNYP
ncbi:MAG: type II toxin-antitoxin system VapC family toxin [Acidobacteriota bacterium]|nr:type II toxin-antitoxin system VapC family toxin [Acidobacteriota bacterium]